MSAEMATGDGPYRENEKPEQKYTINMEISMKSGKVHKVDLLGILESDVNRKVYDILVTFMKNDQYGYGKHPHKNPLSQKDYDRGYSDQWPAAFHQDRIASVYTKKFEPVLFLNPAEIESLSYHVVAETNDF